MELNDFWINAFLIIGFDALFITLIVMLIITRVKLVKSVKRMTKLLNKYSNGEFESDVKVKSRGSLGRLEQAVSEIGISLAISDYETKTMINSFYRFVPRGIEKILDRAGITEINPGDATTVKDNICILSVVNREKVISSTDDKGFMIFVNNCFGFIYEQVQNRNGMLLSGDFNLNSLPILFKDSPMSGIRFGLGLTYTESEFNPDFFLMLHNAKFLYGVAGTNDKAFPFLSSCEINFLSSYSHRLHSIGTKMVITEQYLKELEATDNPIISNRFIGFISSDDKQFNFKLYEVLDCYTDSQRLVIERYNERFQKAINLFLKNDFYLARSEFSEILHTNPSDGVAKWYVFACENFFNSTDVSNITYNLFGISAED